MPWTENWTIAFQEGGTSAKMNLLGDNFDLLGPHLIARKTIDESLTSNTTFQDDDIMQLPVLANETWKCEFGVWFTGGAGNLKIQFTFPTGGVIGFSVAAILAANLTAFQFFQGSTSPSTSANFICQTGNTYLPIVGIYANGGTAGTVIMQWAQNTSNATPTTVKANSSVWGMKFT
jgi:hypothetical protein